VNIKLAAEVKEGSSEYSVEMLQSVKRGSRKKAFRGMQNTMITETIVEKSLWKVPG